MLAFCLNFCVLPKFFYCDQNRSQSLGRSLSLLRAQKLARVFCNFHRGESGFGHFYFNMLNQLFQHFFKKLRPFDHFRHQYFSKTRSFADLNLSFFFNFLRCWEYRFFVYKFTLSLMPTDANRRFRWTNAIGGFFFKHIFHNSIF